MYVKVAFPLPIRKLFYYKVPERLRNTVGTGSMVLAPFRNRIITGYVIETVPRPDIEGIKNIEDVCFSEKMFSPEILRLCRWISEYYFAPLGEVLQTALPKGLERFSFLKVRIGKNDGQKVIEGVHRFSSIEKEIMSLLRKRRTLSLKLLTERFNSKYFFSALNNLEKSGFIQLESGLTSPKVKILTERYLKLRNKNSLNTDVLFPRKAPVQLKLVNYLLNSNQEMVSLREALKNVKFSDQVLKALVNKEIVDVIQKPVERFYDFEYYDEFEKPDLLTRYQNDAVETINKAVEQSEFKVFLIHGITGSGKTQVYIETLKSVLEKGKNAIYLVPEIALTPQTAFRLKEYFKEEVELIHSRMSMGERYDAWRRIKNRGRRLVIGPRSALFAPFENLGMIVVDEEHDDSYKQQVSPRYNARDAALMRAKFNNAVVLLGSATPGMESFYNAKTEKYQLIQLPERIDEVPLPEILFVDMKKEMKGRKGIIFSEFLLERMKDYLGKNEQVLLLQNRRGYSTYLHCKDCGYIEECRNCSVALTYHRRINKLLCHYCGFRKKPPVMCPECKGTNIVFSGTGTQKVQEKMRELFPETYMQRMDIDTVSQKGEHEKVLGGIIQGDYQVLIGTKMISKGFDFSSVNFGGVVNADISLMLPDFRSSERAFQLLTQFAGRMGRRKTRGEVIIQTYNPEHFCLKAVKEHNFEKFFEEELENRRDLDFPPFGRLVLLRFYGEKEKSVMSIAEKTGGFIRRKFGSQYLMGPVPAPIPKISKYFRWNALIKVSKDEDKSGRKIRNMTEHIRNYYEDKFRKNSVTMAIDVDPVNLI